MKVRVGEGNRYVHLEARNHFFAVLAREPGNREAFEALQSQVREVRQVNHTVRAGDSLTSIAQLYYGDRTRSEVIWETNQLPPNPKLTPGMVLKIPEIPGLPFGRPEPAPTAKTPPSGSVASTHGKTEPSEEGCTPTQRWAPRAKRLSAANWFWRMTVGGGLLLFGHTT